MNGWAPWIAIAAAILALSAMMVAILAFGVDEKSTPMLLTVLGMFGTIVTALVGTLVSASVAKKQDHLVTEAAQARTEAEHAKEAAHKSARVGELTASKVSAIQQALLAETPHLCHDPLCYHDGDTDR